MHLLVAQSGVLDGAAEALDLGQTPADLIIISAADSELAALARAVDGLNGEIPPPRLANLLALQHPYSVDHYIDRTARHARLIILRLLGGRSYWPYGVDRLCALASDGAVRLVVLPGGGESDAALMGLSTVPAADCERLRRYFTAGGVENMSRLLRYAHGLISGGAMPAPPVKTLPHTGLYWPGTAGTALADIRARWPAAQPVALVVFYRAIMDGGLTAPVDALISALKDEGLNALPVFVPSLKDQASQDFISRLLDELSFDIVINATGFAIGSAGAADNGNPFAGLNCPVLQVIFSTTSPESWKKSAQGLPARDLAMNVVLPELDGRIITRAVSFKADRHYHEPTQCRIVTYEAIADRIGYVARLAGSWVRLRHTPPPRRRVAIILANYPNRDGRIGNGVGYDTPASTLTMLDGLRSSGYQTGDYPRSGNGLIEALQAGTTNARLRPHENGHVSMAAYKSFFSKLPKPAQDEITGRWGTPENDPFATNAAFHLPVCLYGHVVVAIQPARGYNIDVKQTYHDPALVPPHGYLAFYFWLSELFGAHAIIHNGKHGNLEWLPGKAVGLSDCCYPDLAFSPLPQLYPFIVNDPGEGSQAKRRTCAVIIDHLTPPMTRAEIYGPLAAIEGLVDEYYLAQGLDQKRAAHLKREILALAQASRLDIDSGMAEAGNEAQALERLDAYLCDIKEAQIRDGLHIFATPPTGDREAAFLQALTRLDRGEPSSPEDRSILRALADDLGLENWDPLNITAGAPWTGPRPQALAEISARPWRNQANALERLERLAEDLIAGRRRHDPKWPTVSAVLRKIEETIRPALRACGNREMKALLNGLDGGFIAPGPSGAPTRGRLDVLPTGRNFYSLDNRCVPTRAAWTLGQRSAEAMLERHFQDHGRYPKALGLSLWGTANMRTGGDDVAQALCLIGVRPVWDQASHRVTGYEIIPACALDRPRIDVTLRISGFFRDAFPAQIALFDKAIRAVGALNEPEKLNPVAQRMKAEAQTLHQAGMSQEQAQRMAGFRIFGSKPGAYGAGLQALIDESLWNNRADLARNYLTWGAYAYGASEQGVYDEKAFSRRLATLEAVVHNQDNREHDLLDSDDYYQFEGGMSAAVEHFAGQSPVVYHNDHSRPETPRIRTLDEEISRVMRARVVNPKWVSGVKRHGYKGAFEIAATVDYLFAFAATTGAVKSHHFDLVYGAFIENDENREFIAANNPAALAEIATRLDEARSRGLWRARSNSAATLLAELKKGS